MKIKTFESASARATGDGSRNLVFTISDSSVDRDNDTINVHGWDLATYRRTPVVLWAHSRKDLPVAKATKVGVEGAELVAVDNIIAPSLLDFMSDLQGALSPTDDIDPGETGSHLIAYRVPPEATCWPI